jgi:cytochrome P450
MSEEPIYESPADQQLARRVAALERLAETREILDRTEALAARQRQQIEQSRTDLLEKLSRVQDEHTATLASHGEMLTEILSILRGGQTPG